LLESINLDLSARQPLREVDTRQRGSRGRQEERRVAQDKLHPAKKVFDFPSVDFTDEKLEFSRIDDIFIYNAENFVNFCPNMQLRKIHISLPCEVGFAGFTILVLEHVQEDFFTL
jgi:hypothetical protein